MSESPSYYSIIPANVRYDKRLKANEKLLYGEITALTHTNGYCYATNSYFAKLYEVDKCTISRWIKNLAGYGYIDIATTYFYGTKQIDKRYIKILQQDLIKSDQCKNKPIDEKINTYSQKNQGGIDKKIKTPIDEKIKDNNTSFNNTSFNIRKNIKKEKGHQYCIFKKPTIDDIQVYVNEKGFKDFDTGHFFDHYESNGWMVGKNKMKCWKSSISNWIRQSKKYEVNSFNQSNSKIAAKRDGFDNEYYSDLNTMPF